MEEPSIVKDKTLRKKYLAFFLPKVLSSEAKRIGIDNKNKTAMGELKREVKLRLKQRFACIPLEQIIDDLKSQGKDITIKVSIASVNPKNYNDNRKICFRFNGVTKAKMQWIASTRKQLLSKVPVQFCQLESMFWLHKVAAYHRVPFISDTQVYFATLYIPESDTIIEFEPDNVPEGTKFWNEIQTRFSKLRSQCKNLVILDDPKIDMERFRKEILPACAKNVILGPLGQPMNKVV